MKLIRETLNRDSYGVISVVRSRVYDDKRSQFLVHLEMRDWLNVVAVDTHGRLALVRQFRVGIDDFTLELPGGLIDEGSEALECAKQELIEECGLQSREWFLADCYFPNPAIQNNKIYSFVCVNAEASTWTRATEFPATEGVRINDSEFAVLMAEKKLDQAFFYTSMLLASRCLKRNGYTGLESFIKHMAA